LWPGYGDRHGIWRTELFDPVDLTRRRSDGPSRLGAQIWGQTRCPMCRSGTFNVKRSTLNFQRGGRKGECWVGYGDRHGIWRTELFDPVDLTGRRSDGPGRLGAQIWGQTRCPMCRSGTFNVKRSTLNFQRADRKGAWWPRYGDRHGIWATGLLTRRTCPSTGRTVQAGEAPRYGDRDDA